jgi:hypothetical protein
LQQNPFTHIGSPIDRIDISGYLQACSNTPNVPEQDKVAHFKDAGGMEYNFSWKCSAGRLFMTDGEFGYEFKCDGSAGGCHGATWRQINPSNPPSPTQEPPAPRAPAFPNPLTAQAPPPTQGSAAAQTFPLPPNFPRDAIKTYCAAAAESFESMTFVTVGGGINGGAGPVEWRCSKGAVLICPAGADGVNCSRRTQSRTPLPSMVQACRDYGELSVASGAYSYQWAWECRSGKPVITGPLYKINLQTNSKTPVVFDTQGYVIDEWEALR